MSRIRLTHLSKNFGAVQAVAELNLAVEPGEIYGLVGPDGAGKTTTLRLLCGALQPEYTRGNPPPEVWVGGYDMLHQTDLARAQIGYLPQRFSLYEELSVLENLRFFAEVRGLPGEQWQPRCLQILDFVGLADFTQRRAGQLSGGMRQKLGLAAALVHSPPVLLLDEPTTGVDPVTRQDFWQLIIRLAAEQGTAVLVSTPYMDEAARCTRVGFLRQGRLVVEGTPADLCERLAGRILEVHGQPLLSLRQIARADPGVEDVQLFGDRLHLRVKTGMAEQVSERLEQAAALANHTAQARPVPAGLEDIFIALLESH